MYPMRRLTASGSEATGKPQMETCPEVAGRYPVRILMVVDLPAPFGPRNPMISPFGTVKLMSLTAVTPA